MRKISAMLCVYNDAVFTKACLEGIEPCVDQIVIVEGSWNGERGTYDYGENKRSDDGTRRIVEQFHAKHMDKVILLDSIGDEECSRNLGLNSCEHDWVLHLDSDEFYSPYELKKLKDGGLEMVEEQGGDRIMFDELTFYFNFRYCMSGSRIRMFRTDKGVHYGSGNGVGDILRGGDEKVVHVPAVTIMHFQWVGDRHKVVATPNIQKEEKAQIIRGEDPAKVTKLGGWKWWLNEIYLKFDGTNLEELVKKNRGSIHPWSFMYEEHRDNPLLEVKGEGMFPAHVNRAPWFDFKEKGLVHLEPDLA